MRVWFGQAEAPAWQAEWDVRAGGRYRLVLRDSSGTDYTVRGVYREVEANRRLVFTWDQRGSPFDGEATGDGGPAPDRGRHRAARSRSTRCSTRGRPTHGAAISSASGAMLQQTD